MTMTPATNLLAALLLALPIAASAPAALAQGIDIEVVFNCAADGPIGEQTPKQCVTTRTQLLNNCTACHTFVPIVKAQKAPELWDATLQVHRVRVPDISDDDYAQFSAFLKAHFNDTVPAPALPPELEALGTGLPF